MSTCRVFSFLFGRSSCHYHLVLWILRFLFFPWRWLLYTYILYHTNDTFFNIIFFYQPWVVHLHAFSVYDDYMLFCFYSVSALHVLNHSVVTPWTVANQLHCPWGFLRQENEWVAIPFTRGPSKPRDLTQVFCMAGGVFILWATRESLIHSRAFLKCF